MSPRKPTFFKRIHRKQPHILTKLEKLLSTPYYTVLFQYNLLEWQILLDHCEAMAMEKPIHLPRMN